MTQKFASRILHSILSTSFWGVATLLLATSLTLAASSEGYVELYDQRGYQTTSCTPGVAFPIILGLNGPSVRIHSCGDGISWRIHGSAAIRVEMIDSDYANYDGKMFVYSQRDAAYIGGTNQYDDKELEVSSISPEQETPTTFVPVQPDLYIPIDGYNLNPGDDSHKFPFNPVDEGSGVTGWIPGHNYLVLRSAFFWENSEDVGWPHGPFGNIKVNVLDPSVSGLSYEELTDDRLWKRDIQSCENSAEIDPFQCWIPCTSDADCPGATGPCVSRTRYGPGTLAGPAYTGSAFETPHDEWIDGPAGVKYSNLALLDWNNLPDPLTKENGVTILISEPDGGCFGEDFIGMKKVSLPALGEMDPHFGDPIFIDGWSFGWLELQNVVARSPREPSVEKADYYWYGGWDGQWPEDMGGYQITIVAYDPSAGACLRMIGGDMGTQYHPFTDDYYLNRIVPCQCSGTGCTSGPVVGLSGGKYPAVTLRTRATYIAVGNPVTFGK